MSLTHKSFKVSEVFKILWKRFEWNIPVKNILSGNSELFIAGVQIWLLLYNITYFILITISNYFKYSWINWASILIFIACAFYKNFIKFGNTSINQNLFLLQNKYTNVSNLVVNCSTFKLLEIVLRTSSECRGKNFSKLCRFLSTNYIQ